MRENLGTRWLGILLSLVGVVAILALAATGSLELYIHPRYTVFTVVMGVIGGVATMAALLFAPSAADHGHATHEEADESPSRARRTLGAVGSVLLVLVAIVGLLVIPPATLTASTAQNRDLTGVSAPLDADEADLVEPVVADERDRWKEERLSDRAEDLAGWERGTAQGGGDEGPLGECGVAGVGHRDRPGDPLGHRQRRRRNCQRPPGDPVVEGGQRRCGLDGPTDHQQDQDGDCRMARLHGISASSNSLI